jgi:hypothetical protein
VKLSASLQELGRPISYYPELARFFGSIGAAILFQQLFYWKDKAMHEYIFKRRQELEEETGLSPREQRKAQAVLVAAKILTVKNARLQHELHFSIDEVTLDAQWSKWLQAGRPNRLKLTRRPVSPRGEHGRFESRAAGVPKTVQRSSGNAVRRLSGTPSDDLRSQRLHQRLPHRSGATEEEAGENSSDYLNV